ncbi:DUF4328 domain-containing protein [Kitasatospora sp. NPDC088134]|uniref:DUF4328 domain-containing protein n=1 Tax=Kitasatospora sp. NPDC088134 TaxID=3364071 RepID=UPI003810B1CB
MSSPAVYRSPRGLATAASVLLGLCAVASFGTATGVTVLRAAEPGREPTAGLAVTLFSNGAFALLMLGTAGVFVPWLYRVRVNAEVIAPAAALPPRWLTVGCWFVPLANLFLPWWTIRGVWRAGTPTDGQDGENGQGPVHAWWATMVLASVLALLASGSMESATSVTFEEARQRALTQLLGAELLMTAAAILAILMVRRLTAVQEAHAEAAHRYAAEYGARAGAR